MQLRHRFEYSEVVPVAEMAAGDMSEDAILREVLERSAREAGVPFDADEVGGGDDSEEEMQP